MTFDFKKIIPEPEAVAREALIVLGGVLIAAWILSQFPALKKYVTDASIQVKDSNGNNLY